MIKITANLKGNRTLSQMFPLNISDILRSYLKWWLTKLSEQTKNNFKVDDKVTIIVSIDVFTIMCEHILMYLTSRVTSMLKSFLKVSGFYYKKNSQLCYYERMMPLISLKIYEYLNIVIFQNYWKCCFQKYTSKQKHVQSWQQKKH